MSVQYFICSEFIAAPAASLRRGKVHLFDIQSFLLILNQMNKIIVYLLLLLLSASPSFSQDSTRGMKITGITSDDSITRNLALVVGISSYPNINRLLYADDDAMLFADYLVSEKICEKNNVVRLIDSVATKANFFKELRRFLDRSQLGDRIFIYFAGHGDVETDIESGFLLTYNCERSNYPATDAIDISMLEKFVNAFVNKKVKVVLITDACRSGNLAGGMAGANTTMASVTNGFQNVIKLLSCQPNQLSQEKNYPGGGHGVFTYHLVDGLSGLADKNNDGQISLRELDMYLDEVSTETNQAQIPKVDGNPQTRIARFDEALKLALIAKKSNKTDVGLIKTRGGMDSTWANNPFFQAFNEHMRQLRYTEPTNNNAYYTIQDARQKKQPEAMIEDMKLELAAVLEDEAQKWINKYLRGELENRRSQLMTNLVNARNYLATIENMIGDKDLRYAEIHVKKIFFDAYIIFKNADKKEYPDALAQLENANKLLPNQAWLYNVMGIFYSDQNKMTEAETAYKKAIQLAPSWTYPWCNLSGLYLTLKNFPEAERASRKAIEIDSTDGGSWSFLGMVYRDEGKYAEAEVTFKKALRLDSLNADILLKLGLLYEMEQRYNDVVNVYLEATHVDPELVSAWSVLGGLYFMHSKFSEGEMAYKKAIELDSTYVDPLVLLGLYYQFTERYPESEASFKKAIQIEPANAAHWANLGYVYEKMSKFPEAETAIQKAIQLDPNNDDAWYKQGRMYDDMKKYPEAETAYKKAILIDSSKTSYWSDLGFLYNNAMNLPEKAIPCFEKTVILDPTHEMNWNILNLILNSDGKKAKQIEWLLKKQTYFPADKTIPIQIAYCYIDLGKFEKALQYFPKPQHPDDYYNLACLYAAWGKPADALQQLELAFTNGFADFEKAGKDKYLAPIRDTPAYIALIKKYKGN